jgi:hypothetical protein
LAVIFLNIEKELTTCLWRCKYVGKVDPQMLFMNNNDSTVMKAVLQFEEGI